MLTVVLGLSTALLWGLPDVPLAVAVRRIGPTAVLAGSLIIGTVLIAPVGLFIDFPDVTQRGLLLAALDGLLMAAAYGIAYNAFARCPISDRDADHLLRGGGCGGDRDRVRRAAGYRAWRCCC